MELFREFLNGAGLMDMDPKGSKFTWRINPRNGFVTRERLDRVVVNWAWRAVFSHALAISLPIITSDHAPIILQLTPRQKSGVTFQYEAIWDDKEECGEIIKQSWKTDADVEDSWTAVLNRTKNCKRNLQEWHKATFKQADEELFRLKRKLEQVTSQATHNIDWVEVKRL